MASFPLMALLNPIGASDNFSYLLIIVVTMLLVLRAVISIVSPPSRPPPAGAAILATTRTALKNFSSFGDFIARWASRVSKHDVLTSLVDA